MSQNKLNTVTLTDKQQLAMENDIRSILKNGVDVSRFSPQHRENYMASIRVEAVALGIV